MGRAITPGRPTGSSLVRPRDPPHSVHEGRSVLPQSSDGETLLEGPVGRSGAKDTSWSYRGRPWHPHFQPPAQAVGGIGTVASR